jgi:nucleoside-diphosphate-sugar epimerase
LAGPAFLGRRVVRHLRKSGTTVRVTSRHSGTGDDGIEQIIADAHDQRSVSAAADNADGGRQCDWPLYHLLRVRDPLGSGRDVQVNVAYRWFL